MCGCDALHDARIPTNGIRIFRHNSCQHLLRSFPTFIGTCVFQSLITRNSCVIIMFLGFVFSMPFAISLITPMIKFGDNSYVGDIGLPQSKLQSSTARLTSVFHWRHFYNDDIRVLARHMNCQASNELGIFLFLLLVLLPTADRTANTKTWRFRLRREVVWPSLALTHYIYNYRYFVGKDKHLSIFESVSTL